jgi:PQQ-dependent dehydrogenase (s-GDH family)
MNRATAALAALSALALAGSVASAPAATAGSSLARTSVSPSVATSVATSVPASVPTSASTTRSGSRAPTGGFTRRVVATGLGDPYEIIWGPDAHLWVTEKSGLRVTRVDPRTGAKSTAVSIPQAHHSPGGQDGVLGLALHPLLLTHTGRDFVYVSYDYLTTTPAAVTGELRRVRIVRYTYDARSHRLQSPRTLISGLPGSTDHQSARLRFGPDGKLYYTIGDQGNNQFAYACRPIWAQRLPTAAEVRARNWAAYQGKTLRLNLDGSIPADNPVINGVRSHVWTYGHRNAQGLTFGPHGRLYQAEQGPKTDDEVNLLRRGGNYGWPNVAGFRDDKAYTYNNWSASSPTPCRDLTYSDLETPSSVPQQRESRFTKPMVSPLRTFFTVNNGFNFADPKCAEGGLYFICWPTIAPSSLTYYWAIPGLAIPGWRNSLLMTTLKDGSVYRLQLTRDGQRIRSATKMWTDQIRYRDTTSSPDGRSIYVATDNSGLVRDPNGAPTSELRDPGSILLFRWHR